MDAGTEFERDPRVDAYIDALPEWQRQLCRKLRELIHGCDPELTETIKRRVRPYFVLDGNVCALLAAKDHINLFLYEGTIVPDPHGIITGRTRKTASDTLRKVPTPSARTVAPGVSCLHPASIWTQSTCGSMVTIRSGGHAFGGTWRRARRDRSRTSATTASATTAS